MPFLFFLLVFGLFLILHGCYSEAAFAIFLFFMAMLLEHYKERIIEILDDIF